MRNEYQETNSQESEYRRIFRKNVPHDFIGETLRLLINTYQSVWKFLEQRYPSDDGYGERHDLFPQILRTDFNSAWRRLANRHAGVVGKSAVNNAKNSYRTDIFSGKVKLNSLAVDTPRKMQRFLDGQFRNVLAEENQLSLFDNTDEPQSSELQTIYGVLLHGPSQAKSPGFTYIGFPRVNSDGKIIYEDMINLIYYYPEMLELYKAPVEKEEDIIIRLKPSHLDIPEQG